MLGENIKDNHKKERKSSMKRILQIFSIIALVQLTLTSTLTAGEGKYRPGDIVFSLLKPAQFKEAHNQDNGEWALLAGQKFSKYELAGLYAGAPLNDFKRDSDTGEITGDGEPLKSGEQNTFAEGSKFLPDARGLFLRGMNFGKPPKAGDPDRSAGGGAGTYQEDEIKSHSHKLSHEGKVRISDHGKGRGRDSKAWEDYHGGTQLRVNSSGGSETRPKNIALYIYVFLGERVAE
jgi:hypothetical protein